jgi:hypothetical protein
MDMYTAPPVDCIRAFDHPSTGGENKKELGHEQHTLSVNLTRLLALSCLALLFLVGYVSPIKVSLFFSIEFFFFYIYLMMD